MMSYEMNISNTCVIKDMNIGVPRGLVLLLAPSGTGSPPL